MLAIDFEALSFEFDLLTVAVSMSTPALNRAAFIDTRRTFLSRFKGFYFSTFVNVFNVIKFFFSNVLKSM